MTIVEFLERDDVLVGLGDGSEIVVHHKYGNWEGCGENVIAAARMAMLMEEKYKNERFRITARSIGQAIAKGAVEQNLATITIRTRYINQATALHQLLLELKESCK